MSKQEFINLVGEIAKDIEDKPVDSHLADYLNQNWPKEGADFQKLSALCKQGESEGWLMQREAGGIKFGRAIKQNHEAKQFSVDVVRMKNVKGPHHIHPNGEIGAVIPIEGDPKFDNFDAGWYVYEAGSAHHPTITEGDAYVLYFLPEGAIEFTGK